MRVGEGRRSPAARCYPLLDASPVALAQALMDALPASPALAIWDRDGKLAYAGPYSEGLVCNSSNSFVEPVLDALTQGRHVSLASGLAVGCYCAWK